MDDKIIYTLLTLFNRPNELRVFRSLLLIPNQSRPELAASLGFSLSSVTNVVDGLIRKGFIVETGMKKMDSGRSSATLDINKKVFVAIGVGISKHKTSVEVIDLDGKVLYANYDVLSYTNWETNFQIIDKHIASFIKELDKCDYHILGIGISRPGFVQFNRRELSIPAEMYEWDNEKVTKRFEDKFQYGVTVKSTATAVLSGEVYFGNAQNAGTALLINFSTTSVSCSLIRNHLIDARVDSNAKAFGNRIIGASSNLDGTIHECTLNQCACRESIEKNYLELAVEKKDYTEISRLALLGNPLAVQAISKSAVYAGLAASDLICSFVPDTCIILGVIAEDNPIYTQVLLSVARNRTRRLLDVPVQIDTIGLRKMGEADENLEKNFLLGLCSATLVFENFYLVKEYK